jgi:hypothetical protein
MMRPNPTLQKSTIGRLIIMIALIACIDAPCLAGSRRALRSERTANAAPTTPSVEIDPLTVTPQMRSWVLRQVPSAGRPEIRLQKLYRALQRLGLRTAEAHTGTARQAFESRQADCVAYAHLFIALARELDLSVSFALVDRPEETVSRGSVRVDVNHMAVVHGSARRMVVIDMGGITERPRPAPRRISDGSAAAVLHSNRGVQQLLAGKLEAAKTHLWRATDLDPLLCDAWTNLGVTLRRAGDHSGAEFAYRRAVASDPESLAAWRNLAILLSGTYRDDRPTSAN